MSIFKAICLLLCGVGVFLAGMKLMGEGLGKGGNKGIRVLFGKISDNRLASYALGAGSTAIVQSSAATTVMSMGLVNAGIMSVPQASAFVLGARLGTTITGILVSLSSISVTEVLMAMAFVGICLILFVKRNDRAVAIGFILCGLGVLFAGMKIMKGSILDEPAMKAFFVNMFKAIDFPLLLVLVGAVFTALIQSSSATAGIVITLIGAGTLDMSQAMFLTIGATVGTCFTALLAGIGAGTNAKRVSVFNILTAVIGVLTVGSLVWALRPYVVKFFALWIKQQEWQVSTFGVFYSLLASIILLPFIKPLDKLVALIVREKPKKEAQLHCYFIDERLLKTPAVAVLQARQEAVKLAELARQNLERGINSLLETGEKEADVINAKEDEIDFITNKLSEYLVSLASLDLMFEDEMTVGSLHHVIDDIERIGDHALDFYKMGHKMRGVELSFSQSAVDELRDMADNLFLLYDAAYTTFADGNELLLPRVNQLEQRIDDEKKCLANNHVERLVRGECTIETGTFFYSAISSLERIGDHLENLAYSVRSITGDTK